MMNSIFVLVSLSYWFTGSKGSLENYPACIDDSDCVGLGHKYACFLYMCYPWKEPDSELHPICSSDWDCWNGNGKCYRHHRIRQIGTGICFRSIRECFGHEDCTDSETPRCCGRHCCPSQYFDAWSHFPCSSDVGCQSLFLGSRCCSDNKMCCDDETVSTQAAIQNNMLEATSNTTIAPTPTVITTTTIPTTTTTTTSTTTITTATITSYTTTTDPIKKENEYILCERSRDNSGYSNSSTIIPSITFLVLYVLISIQI